MNELELESIQGRKDMDDLNEKFEALQREIDKGRRDDYSIGSIPGPTHLKTVQENIQLKQEIERLRQRLIDIESAWVERGDRIAELESKLDLEKSLLSCRD